MPDHIFILMFVGFQTRSPWSTSTEQISGVGGGGAGGKRTPKNFDLVKIPAKSLKIREKII